MDVASAPNTLRGRKLNIARGFRGERIYLFMYENWENAKYRFRRNTVSAECSGGRNWRHRPISISEQRDEVLFNRRWADYSKIRVGEVDVGARITRSDAAYDAPVDAESVETIGGISEVANYFAGKRQKRQPKPWRNRDTRIFRVIVNYRKRRTSRSYSRKWIRVVSEKNAF